MHRTYANGRWRTEGSSGKQRVDQLLLLVFSERLHVFKRRQVTHGGDQVRKRCGHKVVLLLHRSARSPVSAQMAISVRRHHVRLEPRHCLRTRPRRHRHCHLFLFLFLFMFHFHILHLHLLLLLLFLLLLLTAARLLGGREARDPGEKVDVHLGVREQLILHEFAASLLGVVGLLQHTFVDGGFGTTDLRTPLTTLLSARNGARRASRRHAVCLAHIVLAHGLRTSQRHQLGQTLRARHPLGCGVMREGRPGATGDRTRACGGGGNCWGRHDCELRYFSKIKKCFRFFPLWLCWCVV